MSKTRRIISTSDKLEIANDADNQKLVFMKKYLFQIFELIKINCIFKISIMGIMKIFKIV
jgi:hypothetical protein